MTTKAKFVASAARTRLRNAEQWDAFVLEQKAVVEAREARANRLAFEACVIWLTYARWARQKALEPCDRRLKQCVPQCRASTPHSPIQRLRAP
jgi:hypothetical protein